MYYSFSEQFKKLDGSCQSEQVDFFENAFKSIRINFYNRYSFC